MNMKPGSLGLKNAQENQRIVLEGLRSLNLKEYWLLWLHQGSYFEHFPKDIPFLVEHVSEQGVPPYIQTIQLGGDFVTYPLNSLHLITKGINKNSDGTFSVIHLTMKECMEILRENRRPIEVNFCALTIFEVIEYLEERERFLEKERLALTEKEKKLTEEKDLYGRKKGAFLKERGIHFKKIICFDG